MSGLRILLVEDEAVVAEDLADSISRLGYEHIDIAGSGPSALELAEKNRPDAVLMDIKLKGEIDGIATAQAIRDRYRTPIIYLTAYSDKATMERAKRTEPFGYLLKPFNVRELHSTIEIAVFKGQMEEQIRKSARWYASTLRGMSDGVITTDTCGRVTFMNPAAELITGQTAIEALGHPLGTVMQLPGAEAGGLAETPVEAVLREGGPVEMLSVTMFNARRGTIVHLADSAAPIRDDTGKITGVVIVFRDLTLHHRQEEARRQELKIEALGRLSAGISHDFNNLLTGIIGYATLIAEKSTDPVSRRQAEEIKSIGERSAALTRQLLTFSRKHPAQAETCDLCEIVTGMRDLLSRTLGDHIVTATRLCGGPALILADAGHIEQVLMNLAVNAADAMPSGGQIRLEVEEISLDSPLVTFSAQLAPGDYVVLTVSDTGRGIDPAVLPHIFEPFFTTKESGYGTGLGLATVLGLLRQNHAQILVESAPGQGATFRIYFPSRKPTSEAAAAKPVTPSRPLEPGTILVVEDQPYLLSLVAQVLRDAGYQVLEASGMQPALAAAEQHRGAIHLLLSDISMPGGSGLELAKSLRAARPDLQLMFMSGYGENVLGGGAGTLSEPFEFIQKPFDPDDLVGRIAEMLGRSAPIRESGVRR